MALHYPESHWPWTQQALGLGHYCWPEDSEAGLHTQELWAAPWLEKD